VWSTTFINPDGSSTFYCTSIWFRNPYAWWHTENHTKKTLFSGSRVLVRDVHADLVEVPPRELILVPSDPEAICDTPFD
jgi:hypothetical protein